EVLPRDHDPVGRGHPTGRHERLVARLQRQSDERIAPELLVLIGDRGHEVQVLGGDDLVGVDVVAEHVDGSADRRHWRSSRGSVMWPVTADAATVYGDAR